MLGFESKSKEKLTAQASFEAIRPGTNANINRALTNCLL